jgi:hypothetical protein
MGTVKKKLATPAAAKQEPTPAYIMLRAMMDPVGTAAHALTERLNADVTKALEEAAGPSGAKGAATVAVPQDLIAAAHALLELGRMIGKSAEVMKGLLKQHHEAGGSFGDGAFTVAFKTTVGAKPSWKDEAISVAQQLAALKPEPFDTDVYVAQVQARAPVSESTSVVISEAK